MGIVSMILARAIRFGIDGLQGPANEEAREILERRLAEAEARRAEDLELLSGTIMAVSRALSQRHDESVCDAAERVVAERDEERASASAWEKYSDSVRSALGVGDGERTEDAARRVFAERDTLRAELEAIRSATDEEVKDEALYLAAMAPSQRMAYRALYNLGRTARKGEIARLREESAALRADLARISEELGLPPGIGPAPGELRRMLAERPVAREELSNVGEKAIDLQAARGHLKPFYARFACDHCGRKLEVSFDEMGETWRDVVSGLRALSWALTLDGSKVTHAACDGCSGGA